MENLLTSQEFIKLKPLTVRICNKAGRTAGRIVSSRRGFFHRHMYRFIDFKRTAFSEDYGLVLRKLYAPGISTDIALVCFPSGGFTYILCPSKLKIGDIVQNNAIMPTAIGDSSQLRNIPSGVLIHNVSLLPKGHGQLHDLQVVQLFGSERL